VPCWQNGAPGETVVPPPVGPPLCRSLADTPRGDWSCSKRCQLDTYLPKDVPMVSSGATEGAGSQPCLGESPCIGVRRRRPVWTGQESWYWPASPWTAWRTRCQPQPGMSSSGLKSYTSRTRASSERLRPRHHRLPTSCSCGGRTPFECGMTSAASSTFQSSPYQALFQTRGRADRQCRGPYALVRHLRYSLGLRLVPDASVGLGSSWGRILLPPFLVLVIWRLPDEER
jgi:hypothetical protein